MAKLSRMGPDESTAVRKICQWSTNGFSALNEMLESFETYQTLDVKPSGHVGRIDRGELLAMSNVMFKVLGMCSEQYFVCRYREVVEGSISLKELINCYQEMTEIKKVRAVLSLLAGNVNYESLKQNFSDKFECDKLKNFVGAEVKGDKKNNKAILLENYYLSVIAENDNTIEPPVQFEESSDIAIILWKEDFFTKYDTIFVHMKELNQELCKNIISQLLNSSKPVHSSGC